MVILVVEGAEGDQKEQHHNFYSSSTVVIISVSISRSSHSDGIAVVALLLEQER